MSINELWAVHISGPDDLYAAPNKAEAERVAQEINETIPPETCIEASVVVWPYDELSHYRESPNWKSISEVANEH